MTTWMIFFAVLAVGAFLVAAVQAFPEPVRERAGDEFRADPRRLSGQEPAPRRAMRVPEDRC